MGRTVSIGDDIINSRDIESRIKELREELEGTPFADPDAGSVKLGSIYDETPEEWYHYVDNLDADSVEELIKLVAFKEEAEPATCEWKHGATFIRDSYFRTYAEDLADDIGAINRDAGWPANCIDWDAAASQLKADYTTIEVGGETYYTRA